MQIDCEYKTNIYVMHEKNGQHPNEIIMFQLECATTHHSNLANHWSGVAYDDYVMSTVIGFIEEGEGWQHSSVCKVCQR